MNWKNWPYWLKGGIMGEIIILLLSLINFFTPNTISINDPEPLFSMAMVLLFIIIWSLPGMVIGALIGWIVGKIKSRNK